LHSSKKKILQQHSARLGGRFSSGNCGASGRLLALTSSRACGLDRCGDRQSAADGSAHRRSYGWDVETVGVDGWRASLGHALTDPVCRERHWSIHHNDEKKKGSHPDATSSVLPASPPTLQHSRLSAEENNDRHTHVRNAWHTTTSRRRLCVRKSTNQDVAGAR